MPFKKPRWPPGPLNGWDIFNFFFVTAEWNSMKTIWNLTGSEILLSSTKFVFLADGKTKMVALTSNWLRHFQLLLCRCWTAFNNFLQEALFCVDKVQFVTLIFDLLTPNCIGIVLYLFYIYHLCMKYKSCVLNTTQVIVLEPKDWNKLVVTLTFALLIPKCIGIFFSPSCIHVWNMKAVGWKPIKLPGIMLEPNCWQS